MKKKVLGILLISILVVSLTGCNSNNNKTEANNKIEKTEKQDENISIVKELLSSINDKNFEKAVDIIDKDKFNELMKTNLPNDEFSKALNRSLNDGHNDIKYDTESIKKISKDELLDEISKMDEKDTIKNRKDIIDLFDGYDLYYVEAVSSYDNEKIDIHDVIFIKDNDTKTMGTVILNGLIRYYYNAVYNKPSDK